MLLFFSSVSSFLLQRGCLGVFNSRSAIFVVLVGRGGFTSAITKYRFFFVFFWKGGKEKGDGVFNN